MGTVRGKGGAGEADSKRTNKGAKKTVRFMASALNGAKGSYRGARLLWAGRCQGPRSPLWGGDITWMKRRQPGLWATDLRTRPFQTEETAGTKGLREP